MKNYICRVFKSNADEKKGNYVYQSFCQLEAEEYARKVFIEKGKIYPVYIYQLSDIEYVSLRSLIYAEKHGVIEYHYNIEKNTMTYYTSFPAECTTYKCIVNLNTYKEKRTALKRYYKAYADKVNGLYCVNYMV